MSGVGVRVSREGPGLALPTSLSGTVGSVTGDDIDWVDGGGAPGSITGSGDFELKNEGGQDYIKPHGSLGSAATFDPTDGNVHTGTLNANCTFTLDAPTGTGFCSLEFWLTQDGTGGWAVTWPGSVTVVGTPDTTLSTTSRVVVETVDGGTTWIATWVGASGSGSSLPWFVVTDSAYGATGNGSTDDTAAINLAIAALNTATKGVLYFPAGSYKVTSALTTITATGMALGDGMASYDNAVGATRINFTSQTAVLFTVSAKAFRFEGIGFVNTFAGTPSAGTAILADSSYLEQRVDYEACSFQGFYDNVDVKVGAQWSMRGCFNIAPVRYGLRVRNTVNVDAGDWSISDCAFSAQTYDGQAAIRVESSGGGKIVNTKVNMALDAKHFTTGIDFAIPTSTFTSVALISACSVENVTGDAVRFITTGTGSYGGIAIAGLQVALYSNNTGRAVVLNAASAGAITGATIDGCVFITDGTARAAIALTNTDKVTIGDLALVGFNARYTSSGDTNTTDGATPSFATPAIVLGTAAAAGAATTVIRSDGTIVAFDATVPVTQAFSDTAATGSAAFAARRDHKHGMPASPAVTAGVLLIADTHSTPLVFADLIQTDAQDDLLYSD